MASEVIWYKPALEEVRDFTEDSRKALGYLIYRLQQGEKLSMPHSRPMPSLGTGCHELRVKDDSGAYRVFYYLKIKDQILIFHAFQKKTEKTSNKDLEQGKKNLKEMI